MLTIAILGTLVGIIFLICSFIYAKDKSYKIGSAILMVVGIIVGIMAYVGGNAPSSLYTPPSQNQIENHPMPQPSTLDNDSQTVETQPDIENDQVSVQTDLENTEEPVLESVQEVTGSIKGNMFEEDQRNSYSFTAPISGIYRFDFGRDSVNYDYTFTIWDPTDYQLNQRNASHPDGGVTVELIKGQEYRIEVRQRRGLVEYEIVIHTPSEIFNITSNIVDGSITFTDQRDRYTFTAPLTGTYRFDFWRNSVNYDYTFIMWDSRDVIEAQRNASHPDGGITVDLIEGEEYRIEVRHRRGLVVYEITINKPNEIYRVTNNTINGSITFTDQRNRYTFTAPATGNYRFDFGRDSVSYDYTFIIWNYIDAVVAQRNASHPDGGIVANLTGGREYRIEVRHRRGSVVYTIAISSE